MKKFHIGGIEVARRVPRRSNSFFGTDLSTGQKLVLKRFSLDDDEERKRFRKLQEASSRGESSGVAGYRFISERNVGYVVREYVPGHSLNELSKMAPHEIVDFGVQISRQLAQAHNSGIAHGNLKASNLVLTNDRKIKILDFGLTGTRQDPRADLHAVGTVLTKMIDKRRRTPPELKIVLDKLVQPEAVGIASAEELHNALQGVRATLPPSTLASAESSKMEKPVLERFVNTWLRTEGEQPTIRTGEWCDFHMNIGAPRTGDIASVVPFREPDWGNQQSLHLLIALFSRDFEIKTHSLDLELPRSADSPVVSAKVKPLHAGSCGIEVVISLARELEVLQVVDAVVQVEEAVVSALRTA